MKDVEPIKIDVDGIIRKRLPRHYRYIPRFLIRWVENIICQKRMNEMLVGLRGLYDADFCRGLLDQLRIQYEIKNAENLPPVEKKRFLLVSNHPLGALDGVVMIDYLTRLYGGKVKFVVNDLLLAISPLKGVFVPINKHGRQSRKASCDVDEAFASDDPVIVFPAGMCSRRQSDGSICDLEWKKMFVNKAVEHQRDIIPVYFNAQNSSFFYKFAKFRTRIGLKFNVEMILLPREMLNKEDARFEMVVGKPIEYQALKNGKYAKEQAAEIKELVYKLKEQ
ncbi:MAG: 1-acyl-sn-glycerol-3-phosphate acyltransferase [Muribaculaceae bacterium]|mgnify:CR=1 FL=1|jgi:putative hemolysin|nr:1-acyl-sn-glycerol-3-phosphate acyltransferase [Muribaculaceae bacterium]MEE0974516.1 1-acyl-sn-glycerol-3-phosphate acyltransferase [Muribaculaceae bacterium]